MVVKFSLDTVFHFFGRVHHFGDFRTDFSQFITSRFPTFYVVIVDMNLTDFFNVRRLNRQLLATEVLRSQKLFKEFKISKHFILKILSEKFLRLTEVFSSGNLEISNTHLLKPKNLFDSLTNFIIINDDQPWHTQSLSDEFVIVVRADVLSPRFILFNLCNVLYNIMIWIFAFISVCNDFLFCT
jgi:hypothetical protein